MLVGLPAEVMIGQRWGLSMECIEDLKRHGAAAGLLVLTLLLSGCPIGAPEPQPGADSVGDD